MVTGGGGPNGAPAPKPVELELIQDPGNVTRLLLPMEEKIVQERRRRKGNVIFIHANQVHILSFNLPHMYIYYISRLLDRTMCERFLAKSSARN